MKRTLNNKQDAVAASDGSALSNEKENERENSLKIAKKSMLLCLVAMLAQCFILHYMQMIHMCNCFAIL